MSKFQMVNLCNNGTKDLVEQWGIIYFKIRKMKLFWINLKNYSQTC